MSKRRPNGLLILVAGIIAVAFVAAGCNAVKSAAGAVKSAAASHGVTVSPPSLPTRSAAATSAPPTPQVTTAPPSASPSPSPSPSPTAEQASPTPSPTSTASSSAISNPLLWALIALAVIVVIGLIIWATRASGRRSAAAARWQSQVADAYAKGSALADAVRLAEGPGALAAPDAPARWADIQARMDDLGQTFYRLQEAAPDEGKRQRVADALGWMQAVRATMTAERGPDGASIPPERVRGRLASFQQALQLLREPDDGRP